MKSPLDKLKEGVLRFRSQVYSTQAALYQRAEIEPQRPHTLFIACSDSRIDPAALTQAAPGEVFVMRNIGNLVPAFGNMTGGVSAAIEFAVQGLRVQHVAICGHSDCGAMKALLDPHYTDSMPTVAGWLTNAEAALTVANSLHSRDAWRRSLLKLLTEQNVLLQMQHLRTHPSVAGAMALGELSISGWVYDIGRGEVRIAEGSTQTFTPVGDQSTGV